MIAVEILFKLFQLNKKNLFQEKNKIIAQLL
jgi:hypothetical protein